MLDHHRVAFATQNDFLNTLNIQTRLAQLVRACQDPKSRRLLESGYQRLVSIGNAYKILSTTSC
jgi:hypothetical protein